MEEGIYKIRLHGIRKHVTFDTMYTPQEFPLLNDLSTAVQQYPFPRAPIMAIEFNNDFTIADELCYLPVFRDKAYLTGAAFNVGEGRVGFLFPSKQEEQSMDALAFTQGNVSKEAIDDILRKLVDVLSVPAEVRTNPASQERTDDFFV